MPTALCKTTESDDVELLCCTALTSALFQELELVSRITTFSFHVETCPFRWSHLARMKHNRLCLQTGVAVAVRESVSQAATPAIRTICAARSAQMFPLAPLKVADVTGGLDDICRGFYHVKIRFRPKMANVSGWMIYPWMWRTCWWRFSRAERRCAKSSVRRRTASACAARSRSSWPTRSRSVSASSVSCEHVRFTSTSWLSRACRPPNPSSRHRPGILDRTASNISQRRSWGT